MSATARKALLFVIALTVSAVLFGGCNTPTARQSEEHPHGKVELVRDRWGVPHVFAETDAGAMYGPRSDDGPSGNNCRKQDAGNLPGSCFIADTGH